jgi:hypothetical protein
VPDDIVIFLLLVLGDSVKVALSPMVTGFFKNELLANFLNYLLLARFWEESGTDLGTI